MLHALLSSFFRRCLPLVCLLLLTQLLLAQPPAGSVGLGAQFGQPTGISLKFSNPSGMSADLLVAWDLGDFIFFNLHGIYERPISGRNFYLYYGPGFFLGFRDTNGRRFQDDDLALGISGNFGLAVLIDRLEIFGQLTPRLELVESTSGGIGGGFGLRFYFSG